MMEEAECVVFWIYSELYGDIELEEQFTGGFEKNQTLKQPTCTMRLSLPADCHSILKQCFLQHQQIFN